MKYGCVSTGLVRCNVCVCWVCWQLLLPSNDRFGWGGEKSNFQEAGTERENVVSVKLFNCWIISRYILLSSRNDSETISRATPQHAVSLHSCRCILVCLSHEESWIPFSKGSQHVKASNMSRSSGLTSFGHTQVPHINQIMQLESSPSSERASSHPLTFTFKWRYNYMRPYKGISPQSESFILPNCSKNFRF